MEILIAMAIFLLLSVSIASLAAGNFSALLKGGEETEAFHFAEEGMEAVRSVRDGAWNEIVPSPAVVSEVGNRWVLTSGLSQLINGKYTRTIQFDEVCRDPAGNIASCPPTGGNYKDIHSKYVRVRVSWGNSSYVDRNEYLTNWDSREWTQTDWSGGAGQTNWSNATQYNSDDGNIDNSTTPGQITLRALPNGVWVPAYANSFFDTTDSDFNAGSLSGTAVNGTGAGASVALAQAQQWAEHAASAVATTQNITDVDAIGPSDVWAVTDAGQVLRYNGTNWAVSANLGATVNLRGIDMRTTTDGWAVGSGGRTYRWNGSTWTLLSTGDSVTWNDVFVLAADNVWIVGANGSIKRWNGTAWSGAYAVPAGTKDLKSIYMVSSSDGWAVGLAGKILHWDELNWTGSKSIDTGNEAWNSVFMISASDGWVVGNNGIARHYNGTLWQTVSSFAGSTNLNDVFMLSPSSGWIAGSTGKLYRYSGSAWSEVTDLGGMSWNAVTMQDATHGWTLGSSGRIAYYDISYVSVGTLFSRIFDGGNPLTTWALMYWSQAVPVGTTMTVSTRTGNTPAPDASWSSFSAEQTNNINSSISSPARRYFQYRVTFTRGTVGSVSPQFQDITILYNPVTTQSINDLSIVTQDNIWAVTNNGDILHFDGFGWTLATNISTNDLNSISMVSANDGWIAASGGKIFHWDGTTAVSLQQGSAAWRSLFALAPDNAWVVGLGGNIRHFTGGGWQTGGAWQAVSSPTSSGLNSIYMISASDGWAVGNNGVVLHWNGSSWSSQTISTQAWNSVYMVSATDGWIVGGNGRIYRYICAPICAWQSVLSPTSATLNSVYMVSATDGWIVGAGGTILHWDGSTWQVYSSPVSTVLNAVKMVNQSVGWIVGAQGVILRRSAYVGSGFLTSSNFNMSDPSPVQIIEWDESIPVCVPACSVQFQLRTAPDVSGLPGVWTPWYGAGGAGTYFTARNASLVPTALNGNRWVEYKVFLSGDGASSPVLKEVRVNYK